MSHERELLTIAEFSQRYSISRSSVYKLIRHGALEVRYPLPDAPRIANAREWFASLQRRLPGRAAERVSP
jgi:predicted DNA-binding transcriptional regulator AlpA